jgi:hypothetical protein
MQVISNEKWLAAVSGGEAESMPVDSAEGGGSTGGGFAGGAPGGTPPKPTVPPPAPAPAPEPGLGFVMPSPLVYAFILGTWIGSKLTGK